MKAVTSEFDANASAEDKLSRQNETLTKTIEEQERKLTLLKEGLEKSAQEYGENDTKTLKWKQAVNDATDALNKSKSAMADNEAALERLGNETEEAATETSRLGDVFKGSLLSDVVMRGLDLLADGVRKVGQFMKDAVTDSAQFADDILTMSKVTGMSTDKLQEMSYMADLVDVSVDTVTGSMRRLSKNMLSAEDGTGSAAEAFESLGVEVTDSAGNLRDNEDVFADIIDALAGMDDETRRDATAMTLFGKSAQDLNPLIVAGGDAIKDFADEAHEMGYVLDEETLESLGKVQDGFDRFKGATTAMKNEIGAALAPYVEELTEKLVDFVKKVDWKKVVDNVVKFAKGLKDFVAIAAPAAGAFAALEIAVKAKKWISDFGGSIGKLLTTPAGLAIAAIGTLATVISTIKQSWQNSPLGQIVQQTKDATDNWNEFIAAQKDSADKGLAEINYIQSLKTELDGLIDANGKVKEGYEARAQFITSELSEATGIELELIDGVIQGYDNLSASIEDALKAQRIDTILESEKAAFDEAIPAIEESQKRLQEIIKAMGEEMVTYLTSHIQTIKMQAGAHLGVLQETAAQEKALLDEQIAVRDKYESDYALKLTDEDALLAQHGQNMQTELQNQGDANAAALTEGGQKMATAGVGAVNETSNQMQAATKTAGFERVGEFAADGFANGMGTYTALQKVAKAAIALALHAKSKLMQGLDENSPSKVMMEIGEYATEGFAIGLTNGLSSVRAAMTKTVSAVTNGMAGAIPTPQPTTASLAAGVVNGLASASPAVGGTLTVNLVMPDGKKLAQETIKDFIGVARANGTPITAF